MIRSARIAAAFVGAIALAAATALPASDDDEDPPYLIYIDPATGKYTTVDPMAARSEAGTAARPPTSQGAAPNGESARGNPRGFWPAAALVAVLLLLAGRRRWVQRRSDRSVTNAKVTARSAR